jgi:ATPase subunit of ABC transporter with duplicated ATPase domains
MLTLSNLSMRFGAKILFQGINARFNAGCIYGIIGANGAGKSTLMKILAGQIEQESGQVILDKGLRLSVLEQDHFRYESEIILNVVIQGNSALWGAMSEKEKIYEAGVFGDAENERLGELEMIVAENDGYDADVKAAQLLEGLGIATSKHHEPMSSLPGGEKVRVLLAKCLFAEPEVLLMDEPTNNLDVHSIQWLEGRIKNRKGCTLIVSHDRHFLNATVTHIADVDRSTIRLYTGDYDYYLAASTLAREQTEFANMKLEKRMAELERFVARFSANASKSSQASSRQKLLEKLSTQMEEVVPSLRIYPKFKFKPSKELGKQLLVVESLAKSFPEADGSASLKCLFRDLHINLRPGDRLAIVGSNGVGKTTLLRILAGELEPDTGSFKWGATVQLGYFPQDHRQVVPDNSTPFDWLRDLAPQETYEEIRGFLGRMLFSGPEQQKPTAALSGGERARLLFAKLMMTDSNVLLLDEPTNHLDLESIIALNDALKGFEGSMIFVSHDLEFINSLATQILEITPDGHKLTSAAEFVV